MMKQKNNNQKNSSQNTSWGKVANWYNRSLEENPDTFQQQVIKPNLLRLLGNLKSLQVLDVGSGQGFFAREMAKAGAFVTGVDISSELIAIAKLQAGRNEQYSVCSADNMQVFPSAQFDVAICVLALQNIKNFQAAVSEISRVLKPQGRFLLVLNHPAFRVPGKSAWDFDEKNNIQFRRVDSYLSESQNRIDMNPGEKDLKKKKYTWSFHRPLQVYFKAFQKSGLVVARLEEWVSHRVSDKGARKLAEDKARKEIPMFMCIELKKN